MGTNFIKTFATAGAMMWAGQGFAQDSVQTASINPDDRAMPTYTDGGHVLDDRFIRFGDVVDPILGHKQFCERLPVDCDDRAKHYEIVSSTIVPRIREINAQVNSDILPMSDQDFYHTAELWTYPPRFGDCEDYALEKRRQLLELGIPAAAMSLVVVMKPRDDGNGLEGHAILMVRTDAGDLLLDNLTNKLRLASMTNYQFKSATSLLNNQEWRSITAVGTVSYNTSQPRERPLQLAAAPQ